MGEVEGPTLESQFLEFAKMMDKNRDGTTITLSISDFWLRQAKVLDDRKLTMTDTGKLFFEKYSKTEISFDEWLRYLEDLCSKMNMDLEEVKVFLTTCGLPGRAYCNATFDNFLCWPPTPEGEVAVQRCPSARLSDTSRTALRRCGEGGYWLGKRPNDSVGWTNYTNCFPTQVQALFKFYEAQDEASAMSLFAIAQGTRYMEIVGFSMSLVMLNASLFIFSYYQSLRNSRTRIHKSLFTAMVMQVVFRLILYIDQALVRTPPGAETHYGNMSMRGIDNMPYLCEGAYVLMEYATTVMFMWMFIEGLYLHGVVTANSLRERFSHWIFYVIGWGLPILFTAVWAVPTARHYANDTVNVCWYGYNFSVMYWIVQGPRLAVIVINLCFLLNIMRVLIVKLRRSENTEVEKVRKAVRAALVLLPLLGITNILNMVEPSLNASLWQFGIWSYSTHFLRSFQGFFIALIYCFMNGEVRQVLRKHYHNFREMRQHNQQQRGEGRLAIILRYLRQRFRRNRPQPDQRIVNRVPTPSKPSWLQIRSLQFNSSVARRLASQEEFEMHPIRSQEVNGVSETTRDAQLPSVAEEDDFCMDPALMEMGDDDVFFDNDETIQTRERTSGDGQEDREETTVVAIHHVNE